MGAQIVESLASAFEVVRLAIEPQPLNRGWTTSVQVCLRPQSGGTLVEVVFIGVTDLVVRQTSSNFALTPPIFSIEDRGWDEARFQFTDSSNGSIEFHFVDVELVSGP